MLVNNVIKAKDELTF